MRWPPVRLAHLYVQQSRQIAWVQGLPHLLAGAVESQVPHRQAPQVGVNPVADNALFRRAELSRSRQHAAPVDPLPTCESAGESSGGRPFSERRTNLTWLPFWLASMKPAASSRRFTSRKGSGLSRPNLNLDHTDCGRPGCLRRFEVQFNRFLQVGKSLFFGLALAGDVEFQALGDVPLPLTPNGRDEWSLHDLIVSQAMVFSTVVAVRAPRGVFLAGHANSPKTLSPGHRLRTPRTGP